MIFGRRFILSTESKSNGGFYVETFIFFSCFRGTAGAHASRLRPGQSGGEPQQQLGAHGGADAAAGGAAQRDRVAGAFIAGGDGQGGPAAEQPGFAAAYSRAPAGIYPGTPRCPADGDSPRGGFAAWRSDFPADDNGAVR